MPGKFLLINFIFLFALWYCSEPQDKGLIYTVNGSIPASDMGINLIHEHMLVDFIGAEKTGYHRWDRDKVAKKVLPYLADAKNAGVNTILECTPAFLGRDPLLLKMLSQVIRPTSYS